MKTNISSSEVPFEISMNHPKKCPSCGTENRVDSLLCCRCGAKFTVPASVSFTNVATNFVSEFVLVNGTPNIKPFYICKYEVTNKLWRSVMGFYSFGGMAQPVCVKWYEAVAFCNKLSVKNGLTPCYTESKDDIKCDFNANGYRLPTLAEWEYAAKGGENYKYAGSNNIEEVAWYGGNSYQKLHIVGKKKPNGYGLYDMCGSLWEWCWDLCSSGNGRGRYVCGGSHYSTAEKCEIGGRYYDNPNDSYDNGLRLVRTKV